MRGGQVKPLIAEVCRTNAMPSPPGADCAVAVDRPVEKLCVRKRVQRWEFSKPKAYVEARRLTGNPVRDTVCPPVPPRSGRR